MYLVFDIGATKMRLATSKDGQTISEPRILATPASFEEGIALFEKTAREISNGEKITTACGGIAGPLDQEKKKFYVNQAIPDWSQKPLKDSLEEVLQTSVRLENDAALGGLGEAVSGAGVGFPIVAYLTVGTGVGGAKIVEGKIDPSSFNFEPGYEIIKDNKTLQELISGFSLKRRYSEKPENIKDKTVWNEVEHNLAIGLNNISVLWSPDIIVLGGSIMKRLNLENIKKYLSETLKAYPNPPQLILSKLGELSGLYGALELIRQS